MQLSGLVLDVYDDYSGETLRSLYPSPADIPDGVKQAHRVTPEDMSSLPDDVFALVLVNGTDKLRKYACIDEGNTALSVQYFLKHGHKLPVEAQKVAAANLVAACDWYDFEPSPDLEKVALGKVDMALGGLTAAAIVPGVNAGIKENLSVTNPSGGGIVTPQQRNAMLGKVASAKQAELTGTSLMPLTEPASLKKSTEHTPVRKVAGMPHMVPGHKGEHGNFGPEEDELHHEDYTHGTTPPRLPQGKEMRPVVDVTNSEPAKKVAAAPKASDPRDAYTEAIVDGPHGSQTALIHPSRIGGKHTMHLVHVTHKPTKSTRVYAVHEDDLVAHGWMAGGEKKAAATGVGLYAVPSQTRYPLDTYQQVKAASAYFNDYMKHMSPPMRHEYATNLVKRASDLLIPVSSDARKYGSEDFAADHEIKAAFDARRLELDGQKEVLAVLDGVERVARFRMWKEASEDGEKVASTDSPEFVVALLEEFDKAAGLHRHYDRGIPDPYYSIFGFEKQAEDDPAWSDIIGNESVTMEDLHRLRDTGARAVKKKFGDDMHKEFLKDPVGIYKSLPLPQKKMMIRLAVGVSPGNQPEN